MISLTLSVSEGSDWILCKRHIDMIGSHHEVETLLGFLVLYEGNPCVAAGLTSQLANNAEIWLFLCCKSKQTFEQTIKLIVIWYIIRLIGHHKQIYVLCLQVLARLLNFSFWGCTFLSHISKPVKCDWIYQDITYGTVIDVAGSESDYRITTDTPYLTGELWDVYCEDLRENWPCNIGTVLYHVRFHGVYRNVNDFIGPWDVEAILQL